MTTTRYPDQGYELRPMVDGARIGPGRSYPPRHDEGFARVQNDDAPSQGPGLLASMLKFRWSILAVTVVAALLAYFVSAAQDAEYSASAQVLLSDPRDPGVLGSSAELRFLDPERFFPQQAQRLQSPEVLERAAETLDVAVQPEALRAVTETSSNPDLNTISVRATTDAPATAAAYANAIARAYVQEAEARAEEEASRGVQAIEEQIAQLREEAESAAAESELDPEDTLAASRARILSERIIALESTAADIAAQVAVRGSGVDSVREAEPPEQPSAPDPLRDAALVAFLALALAGAFAYWRAGKDDRLSSAGDAASILGAPLLGEVPEFGKTGQGGVNPLITSAAAAEAFRFVLTSIEHATGGASASVLITSANAGDGKTVSAAQLALAALRHARSPLLVDGDVRARGLTRLLRSEGVSGLTDAILGTATVDEATRRYRIDDDTVLPVVTAGDADADVVAVMRDTRLPQVFSELREQSDLLFVDSPPMLAVADATLMSGETDGIVVVVSPATTHTQLERLATRLNFVSTPVIGYIFNRAQRSSVGEYYNYGHDTKAAGRQMGWLSKLPGNSSHRGDGDRGRTGSRTGTMAKR